jgi:hypothetical protein
MAGVWPRPVAVLEADPDGGVLAVRYGLARNPGLSDLAAAVREPPSADALWRSAQHLGGELPAVLAPESGDIAAGILADVAAPLGSWCAALDGVDVIADCGRLNARAPTGPVLAAASDVLVVARPRAEELHPAAHRLRAVASTVTLSGLILVGDRPYGRDEVASQLGVRVAGVVAHDPRAAAALAGGGSARTLRRSALLRSVRTFVDDLVESLGLPLPEPADTGDGDWPNFWDGSEPDVTAAEGGD